METKKKQRKNCMGRAQRGFLILILWENIITLPSRVKMIIFP
jgi:hypothetical protein